RSGSFPVPRPGPAAASRAGTRTPTRPAPTRPADRQPPAREPRPNHAPAEHSQRSVEYRRPYLRKLPELPLGDLAGEPRPDDLVVGGARGVEPGPGPRRPGVPGSCAGRPGQPEARPAGPVPAWSPGGSGRPG